MKKLVLSLLIFAIIVFCSAGVYAKNCGGAIACDCGDTLNESRILNASDNLTGCTTLTGLEITLANVVLDCDGYPIDGVDQTLSVGVLAQNNPNITIKNCDITDWATGVKIVGSASSSSVLDNTISSNTDSTLGFGINLATANSIISGNTLDTNRIGIYTSGGFSGVIKDNFINNSARDGLYDGTTNLNNITNNTIINSGQYGLNLGNFNAKVWHNNIYNNTQYNVFSGTPGIELSYNNEGNYWGHSCPNVFTSGVDSYPRTPPIVDSYPYDTINGWETGSPADCLECGDTINTSTTLTYDLTNCPGHGLIIGADNVELDCAGHLLEGPGDVDTFGVLASTHTNTVIRNCNISNFNVGIYSQIYSGTNITFENNIIYNTQAGEIGGTGINAGLAPGIAIIRGNEIYNSSEGIRLNGMYGASGFVVDNNNIHDIPVDSEAVEFYGVIELTDLDSSNITGNTIDIIGPEGELGEIDSATKGIIMTNVNDSNFIGNEITSSGNDTSSGIVILRGSNSNLFEDNVFEDGIYIWGDEYEWISSLDNIFRNIQMGAIYPTNVSFIYSDEGGRIDATPIYDPEPDSLGIRNASKYVDFSNGNRDENGWIYFNISYSESDVDDESSLAMYEFGTSRWVPFDDTGVDTVNNVVYGNFTDYGGDMAIMEDLHQCGRIDENNFYGDCECGDTVMADEVFEGNMNCSGTALTIGADDVTIDCDGYTIKGQDSGNGIYSYGYDGVTIKNCNIENFSVNIYLINSAGHNILNNNISYDMMPAGLYLSAVNDSLVKDNNVFYNEYGIYLYNSNNNRLEDNTVYNNTYAGIYISDSNGNNITGGELYYNNLIESSGQGGIHLESAVNSHVSGAYMHDNKKNAIYGWNNDNSTIESNTIDSNCGGNAGISLGGTANVTIKNNDITNGTGYGIELQSSTTAIISNNNVNDNSNYGIYSYSGASADIENGEFISNKDYGIYASTGPVDWTISQNVLCRDNGIRIDDGSISFNGGSLELDNCTINLEGAIINVTGTITSLETETRAVAENTSEEFSFSDADSNITLYLSSGVTTTIAVSTATMGSSPSGLKTLKGIDISVDTSTKGSLTWAFIKIFYDEAELAAANIDEDSLKMYFYNTSVPGWQLEPNQGVNTAANYIWANVTHFSLFGIFGSATSTPSTTSRGGGGTTGFAGTRYTLGDEPLTVTISGTDKLLFTVEGEEHTLQIYSLGEDYVILDLASEVNKIRVNLGQTTKVDVDNNGIYDIAATLNTVSKYSAGMTFQMITEERPEEAPAVAEGEAPPAEEAEEEMAEAVTPEEKGLGLKDYLPLIITVTAIVVVIIAISFMKKKK